MATTTTTVGENVTRTTYTNNNVNKNRGLYWGLAIVAIVIITLAVMLTANRSTVDDTVTPSTSTEFSGAAPAPVTSDTPMSTDLPPADTNMNRGTTDVPGTVEPAPTSP